MGFCLIGYYFNRNIYIMHFKYIIYYFYKKRNRTLSTLMLNGLASNLKFREHCLKLWKPFLNSYQNAETESINLTDENENIDNLKRFLLVGKCVNSIISIWNSRHLKRDVWHNRVGQMWPSPYWCRSLI